MTSVCLSCPLPDCDDASPACPINLRQRAYEARYRARLRPPAERHTLQLLASSRQRVIRAHAAVRAGIAAA